MQSFFSLQTPTIFMAGALCSLIAAFIILSPARPNGNEKAAMLRFGCAFALWSISMATLWIGQTHPQSGIGLVASLTAMGHAACIVHGSIKLFGGRLPISITLGVLSVAALGHLVAANGEFLEVVALIESAVIAFFAGIAAFVAWRARDTAGIDFRRSFACAWTAICVLLVARAVESMPDAQAETFFGPGVGEAIGIALAISWVLAPPFTALMIRGLLAARAGERIRRFSRHDEVTGLLNRNCLFASAQEVFTRANLSNRTVAVIILEFDDLGTFRTRLGQRTSDRMLRNIAGAMRRALRADSILARHDIDTFCAVLPVRNEPEARIVAERLREVAASQEFTIDSRPSNPSVSIGIAMRLSEEPLDALVLAATQHATHARSAAADSASPASPAPGTPNDADQTKPTDRLALSPREC